MKYDVVICVGWNDIYVVKKTVRYIRENLACGTIFFIINKYYFGQYSQDFLTKYGVSLIDEDKLIPDVTYLRTRAYIEANRPGFSPGWYYQQFLKMGFACSPYAEEYYLIWDADTLPLSRLQFEKDGHLLFTAKKEYHEEYFITMKALLNLSKEADFSYIAEHMLIKTSIMKEIICEIVKKGNKAWPFIVVDHIRPKVKSGFSEFETYGTYVMHHYPELYTSRTLNTWRSAGYVFGRNIRDKDIQKLALDLDIISLENWNGKIFPYNVVSWFHQQYVKLLRFRYLKTQLPKRNAYDLRDGLCRGASVQEIQGREHMGGSPSVGQT